MERIKFQTVNMTYYYGCPSSLATTIGLSVD